MDLSYQIYIIDKIISDMYDIRCVCARVCVKLGIHYCFKMNTLE